YGRGSEKPTVTDSDLLLGRISAERFAGGTIRLDEDFARGAIAAHVGRKMRLDAASAPFGDGEVVAEMIAQSTRVHGAEPGKDVAAHTMIAFGGAAPLHAARLAEKLGVSRVIIPRNAGVGSAVGFLMAPLAYDIVISRPLRLDAFDATAVRRVLDDLAKRIRAARRDLGDAAETDIAVTRQVDMRYAGQGHEVAVPLDGDEPTAARLREAFEERYAALFGRIIPGAPVEVVSWQARLSRETWHPAAAPPAEGAMAPKPRGSRGVFDAGAGAFVDYTI